MKKTLALLLALVLVLALFAGCSSKTEEPAADTNPVAADEPTTDDTAAEAEAEPTDLVKIRVAATPTPHAEILAIAKEILAAQGYELEIVEYTDYVQPNLVVDDGELDANYFQHTPYLVQFNDENGTDLVSAGLIHYEPFGIYAGKTASLEELPDGAVVAVPNDASNQTRALLLLQQEGIITLAEGANIDNGASVYDVVENPHNIELQEVEAAQLPNILPDVDIAVINGNYAIGAGLSVATDALAIEDASGDAAQTYANIVAVKAGNESSEAIQALVSALQSQEVKDFIDATYDGAVVAIF